MTHTLQPVDWGLWLSAEKLAKFDSSQVCSEMPCFKRQKAGEAFRLGLVCPKCVWYFYLVIVLPSRTAAIISICYADLSSDTFVYCSPDCIQLIYAVFTSIDTAQGHERRRYFFLLRLPSINSGASRNRITFILHVLCNEVHTAWPHIYCHINCSPSSELNMHAACVIRLWMGVICAPRSHMAPIKSLQIYPLTSLFLEYTH